MSSEERSAGESTLDPTRHLGYLLKHAQRRLVELTAKALAPYGVDGRQWAVLLMLAAGDPTSQHHLATRSGIDRTTMVTLLDGLEAKGLVTRYPHPADRRRNVVELTADGRAMLDRATRAAELAERRFLRPLDPRQAEQLSVALATLIAADHE